MEEFKTGKEDNEPIMVNPLKKVGHMLSKEGEVVPSTRGMGSQLKKMLGETKGSTLQKTLNPMSDGKPGYHREDYEALAKKEGMITDETPLQGDSSGDGPSYDTENPVMRKKDPRYKDMSNKEIKQSVKENTIEANFDSGKNVEPYEAFSSKKYKKWAKENL